MEPRYADGATRAVLPVQGEAPGCDLLAVSRDANRARRVLRRVGGRAAGEQRHDAQTHGGDATATPHVVQLQNDGRCHGELRVPVWSITHVQVGV